MNHKIALIFLVCIVLSTNTSAQDTEKKIQIKTIRFGLNYGQASHTHFPIHDTDYLYENKYFKTQVNFLLKQGNKLRYELNIEPSIYFSKHQLLNKYYIQPEMDPNYLKSRDVYTQKRSFNEYAINLGILMRYKIYKSLSSYLLGSIGPMISGQNTERLKKGFAFSDIVGLGISNEMKRVRFDVRMTLRHCSNANLSQPNYGHNSLGVETGISFQL